MSIKSKSILQYLLTALAGALGVIIIVWIRYLNSYYLFTEFSVLAAAAVHSLIMTGLFLLGRRLAEVSEFRSLAVFVGSGVTAGFLLGGIFLCGYVSNQRWSADLTGLIEMAGYHIYLYAALVLEMIVMQLAAWVKQKNSSEQTVNYPAGNRKCFRLGFLVYAGVMLLFGGLLLTGWAARGFLSEGGVYLRSWVEVVLSLIKWFGFAFATGLFFAYELLELLNAGKKPLKNILYLAGLLAVGAALAFYLLVMGLVYLLSFEEMIPDETVREDGWLVSSDVGNGLKIYCDSYDFLTKTKCDDKDRAAAAYLSNEYGEGFQVFPGGEKDGSYLTAAAPVSAPELIFHIRDTGFSYYEDYGLTRCFAGAEEAVKELGLDRRVEAVYDGWIMQRAAVYCGPQDWEVCAAETAAVIDRILQDSFFYENTAKLTVVCGEEDSEYTTLTLTFGGTGAPGTEQYVKEPCVDAEYLYTLFQEKFQDNIHTWGAPEEAEEGGEARDGAEEGGVKAPEPLTTPEGAGRKLYETVFEPLGYGYEPMYSAKGGFCAVLGSGREELDGIVYLTEDTFVYDRMSENGKCQLFVAYRDYFLDEESGRNVYTTKILDFYAVNMLTGETGAGSKTSWEETASREYQEMTGEK